MKYGQYVWGVGALCERFTAGNVSTGLCHACTAAQIGTFVYVSRHNGAWPLARIEGVN